jgi:cytochrome c oxidase assembly protein subunit 15
MTDAHRIGRWLAAWAAVVFVLVLVGGGTRLTESGLSITEWKPLSGVIPPVGDSAWAAEFEKYKQIPQYTRMNAGMSLGDFKKIYLWEYVHRLLARLGGLVFAIPFFWFALRKRIPPGLMPRLVTIGALTIAQAALGWYMVASGLTERVNVSQYRLAAHLSLAIVIYLVSVWTADELLNNESTVDGGRFTVDRAKWAGALKRLLAMAAITVVSGAFVAGLRAGEIYNEFPMMGAGLVPAEYGSMTPWLKNWFENPAAAQFNHRWLAIATLLTVVIVWFRARPAAVGAMRMRLDLVLAAVAVQVALGITVLLLGVPVIIGIAHQAGALLVLTALVLAVRQASQSAQSHQVARSDQSARSA